MSGEFTVEQVHAAYPQAELDYDSFPHWQGFLRHQLLINRCGDCGYWIYPNLPSCPKCWSVNVKPTEVSGKGTLYMVVKLHGGRERSWRGPTGRTIEKLRIPGIDYTKVPYATGAAELVEQQGLRFSAPVLGRTAEEIAIGAPVELTWVTQLGSPVPAWQVVPTKS